MWPLFSSSSAMSFSPVEIPGMKNMKTSATWFLSSKSASDDKSSTCAIAIMHSIDDILIPTITSYHLYELDFIIIATNWWLHYLQNRSINDVITHEMLYDVINFFPIFVIFCLLYSRPIMTFVSGSTTLRLYDVSICPITSYCQWRKNDLHVSVTSVQSHFISEML